MMPRNRKAALAAVVVTILLGLGSRRYGSALPAFLAEYSGDALWAMMVFFGIGFLASRWSSQRVALAALVFSTMIEFSQLYHAPWIDAIRHTTLGHLVLGHGFLWTDLVCYMVGILLGFLMEKLALRLRRRGGHEPHVLLL